MNSYVQLELPLLWEPQFRSFVAYHRFDGRKQNILAFTPRQAVLIAYAFSVGRENDPMEDLYLDYGDNITCDFCRIRLFDWCIGV